MVYFCLVNIPTDHIAVAIPAMDEMEWLPACLESLAQQTLAGFHVVVCVNQPDGWWNQPGKSIVCRNNQLTLQWLNQQRYSFPFSLTILDRSSRGMGWSNEKGGAGLARRVAMDHALARCHREGVLISADADTHYPQGYLKAVVDRFRECPDAGAIASPYYHPLTGSQQNDLAILRYELFLRFHLLNLIRIKSPYAFTAIGSAIAVRADEYQRVGGVPQRAFGEDFYLLQKVAKRSRVINYLSEMAFPAPRESSRVAFGTGPAMRNLASGEEHRYHIIAPNEYEPIEQLYRLFPALFEKDIPTPVDCFLKELFGTTDIWKPLRQNARSVDSFVRACHQKMDALRIWQIVRHQTVKPDEMSSLYENLKWLLPEFDLHEKTRMPDMKELSCIRSAIVEKELQMRKDYDNQI